VTTIRSFRRGAGALMAIALVASACTTTPGATTAPGSQAASEAPSGSEPAASQAAATGQLEIMSWWTSGGEAAALDQLFAAFKKLAPDVEVVNAAVAGGGGSNAQAVLQTRLAGGDPPDSFQLHSGANLKGEYVTPGYLEPITDLYASEGWNDVIPAGLLEQVTAADGNQYAVLTNVHRGNGFWFNKTVLDANGITVGDKLSSDEFFTAAEKLKAAGVTPLCVGDSGIWASTQLFENTLAGGIGADAYKGLYTGATKWDSDGVKTALATYGKYLDYENTDHATLSWDQAIGKVMDGSCAFSSMGDWSYGEFIKASKVFGTDFGWVAHPGSDGIFVAVDDGFGMPKGVKNAENAKMWLKALMTPEAQAEFNKLKGGIPVRSDVDKAQFDEYHQIAITSFAADAIVPTTVHGAAAPAAFVQALNDAITSFNTDRNVDAFTATMVKAATDFPN
jgi:glucose/mannose transport system substrate-binding protein